MTWPLQIYCTCTFWFQITECSVMIHCPDLNNNLKLNQTGLAFPPVSVIVMLSGADRQCRACLWFDNLDQLKLKLSELDFIQAWSWLRSAVNFELFYGPQKTKTQRSLDVTLIWHARLKRFLSTTCKCMTDKYRWLCQGWKKHLFLNLSFKFAVNYLK